jgi:hypothetical protein
MTDLIATLSAEGASNWEICKREGLWGTGARNNHSKHAVSRTEVGDRIFVWQSGTGVVAVAEVTGGPVELGADRSAPWPDAESYAYGIPIEVVEELREPVHDTFEDYRSRRFGVQTHQLQSGYAVLKPEQAEALAGAFGLAASPAPIAAAATAPVPSEISHSALSAVYLRSTASIAETLLTLYRQSRAAAEGDDLLFVGAESARAEFDAELLKPPFDDVADQITFVTPEELVERIQTGDVA